MEVGRILERYGQSRLQLLSAIESSSLHPHAGEKAIHRLDSDANLADGASPSAFRGTRGPPVEALFDVFM